MFKWVILFSTTHLFIYFFEYLCLNELCYFQPTTFLNFLLFFEYSCSNGLYYFQPTTFFKISFYSLNTHVQTLMFWILTFRWVILFSTHKTVLYVCNFWTGWNSLNMFIFFFKYSCLNTYIWILMFLSILWILIFECLCSNYLHSNGLYYLFSTHKIVSYIYNFWTGWNSLNMFIFFLWILLFEHLCLNAYIEMSYNIFNQQFLNLQNLMGLGPTPIRWKNEAKQRLSIIVNSQCQTKSLNTSGNTLVLMAVWTLLCL